MNAAFQIIRKDIVAEHQHDNSTQDKPLFERWYVLTAIVAVAVVIVAVIGITLYNLITDRVIESSMESTEELALHDEAFIANSLDLRIDTLKGIGEEIRQTRASSISDLLNLLRMKKNLLNSIDLILLSNSGTFYSSSLLIYQDKPLQELCENGGDRFVARFDSNTVSGDQHRQCLIFGVKIRSFEVDGVTFDYLISRLSLDTLANELKIDSYDGEGFSSVIDRDGNYIVTMNEGAVISERENFYEELSDDDIEGGVTLSAIRDAIDNNESFTINAKEPSGSVIMQFTPMASFDWYFITSVPRSVFERQSLDILQIVVVMMAILFLTMIATIVLMIRNRNAQERAAIDAAYREELSGALDLAEQANRAKTVFLSSMSHDIRTPMNAIIGFANLANARVDDPERTREYLQKILQSSNHLLSLINDVLDMSRIESGRVELLVEPANLKVMLEDVYSIVQNQIDERQLSFTMDVDPNAVKEVYVDRLRLNQVLLNVISNAIKYTPEGGSITLTARQLSQNNGQGTYMISVADTGIGMSPEFAATVFESFTREQTSTVSGIQGTGLGMAITKNIIDLMGGTIEVDTQLGEGSTFTIEFTLDQVTDPVIIASLNSDRASGKDAGLQDGAILVDPDKFKGMRLLLSDDNMLSRELATEILEEAGFEVETVEDGAQEVEAIRNSKPGYYDVILSDVQMPVMDGHEAAREIRKLDDPELSSIPIIACTANAFEEDVAAAKAAGMDAHIGKPINIDILIETLSDVLENRKESHEK